MQYCVVEYQSADTFGFDERLQRAIGPFPDFAGAQAHAEKLETADTDSEFSYSILRFEGVENGK